MKIEKVILTKIGEFKEGETVPANTFYHYKNKGSFKGYYAHNAVTEASECLNIYTREVITEDWKPEAGKRYEYINSDGDIIETHYDLYYPKDNNRIALGNCFPVGTAKQYQEKFKEFFKELK